MMLGRGRLFHLLGSDPGTPFRFGVLPQSQRLSFGAPQADVLYEDSVSRLCAMGGTAVGVDFEPFLEANSLYGGPSVAERYVATQSMIENDPDGMLPVTRGIIGGGNKPLATDAFRAIYRLAELKRASEALWKKVDVMLTPTTPRCYTVQEVMDEPVAEYESRHLHELHEPAGSLRLRGARRLFAKRSPLGRDTHGTRVSRRTH